MVSCTVTAVTKEFRLGLVGSAGTLIDERHVRRPESVATGDGSRGNRLHADASMAERRTIRSYDPTKKGCVSVPSNIAEGKGRASDRDFAKFLNYARGSIYEVQTQLKIARRLGYLSANTATLWTIMRQKWAEF